MSPKTRSRLKWCLIAGLVLFVACVIAHFTLNSLATYFSGQVAKELYRAPATTRAETAWNLNVYRTALNVLSSQPCRVFLKDDELGLAEDASLIAGMVNGAVILESSQTIDTWIPLAQIHFIQPAFWSEDPPIRLAVNLALRVVGDVVQSRCDKISGIERKSTSEKLIDLFR